MATNGNNSSFIVWEWLRDNGSWAPYESSVSCYIESHYGKSSQVYLGSIKQTMGMYILDLSSMCQIRQGSGTARPIRRKSFPLSYPCANQIVWQWAGDPAGNWTMYDVEVSCLLEDCYRRGQKLLDLSSTPMKQPYYLNLSAMQQVRIETGTCRDIRRHMLSVPYTLINGVSSNLLSVAHVSSSGTKRSGSDSDDGTTALFNGHNRRMRTRKRSKVNVQQSAGQQQSMYSGQQTAGQQATGMSGQHMAGSSGQLLTASAGQQATGMSGQQIVGSSGQLVTAKLGQQATGMSGQQIVGSSGQHIAGSSGQHFTGSSRHLLTGQHITGSSGQIIVAGQHIAGSSGQLLTGQKIVGGSGQLLTAGQHIVGSTGQLLTAGQHIVSSTGQILTAGQHIAGSSGQLLTVHSGQHIVANSGQLHTSGQHIATNSRHTGQLNTTGLGLQNATMTSNQINNNIPLPPNSNSMLHGFLPSSYQPLVNNTAAMNLMNLLPQAAPHSSSTQAAPHSSSTQAAPHSSASQTSVYQGPLTRSRYSTSSQPTVMLPTGYMPPLMFHNNMPLTLPPHFSSSQNIPLQLTTGANPAGIMPSLLLPPFSSHKSSGVRPPPIFSKSITLPKIRKTKSKTAEEVLKKYLKVEVKPQDEDCCICCDKLHEESTYSSESTSDEHQVVCLKRCSHVFHRMCLYAMYNSGQKDGSIQCPTCKLIYGERFGNCPPGEMEFCTINHTLSGHPGCCAIKITYMISPGIQGPEHPNPGKRYNARGFPRFGFLPDNEKGRKVLQLLTIAWQRRLMFTIGTSVTTDESDTVTWNEIHHKTECGSNASGHGYPDPNYLDNVTMELSVQGVTEDDV